MNKEKTILSFVLGLQFVLLVYLLLVSLNSPDVVTGSVIQGNEYFSTTTKQAMTGVELTNLKVLKTGSGSLAQVTITGAGAGVINFYDATTSDATLRTRAATTTIASFPASTAAGTYTYDAMFFDGLLFEEVGTVATSSIMWR